MIHDGRNGKQSLLLSAEMHLTNRVIPFENGHLTDQYQPKMLGIIYKLNYFNTSTLC